MVGFIFGPRSFVNDYLLKEMLVSEWQQSSADAVFLSFFFFPLFLPKSPQYIVVYLVVGPSSCAMWDATSAWPDEQGHARPQDPNQQNPGPPKRSVRT